MEKRNRSLATTVSGVLSIVTQSGIVFQGTLVRESSDDRKICQATGTAVSDFLVLELQCEPAIIGSDAQMETISPALYEEGDIIRIRRSEIIAFGPSNGCLVEASD